MTTRYLQVHEWVERLKGTEAETLVPHLNPDNAEVIVVEDDGRVVGCWVAMRVMHAEALWIAPEYRGRFDVMRRLWRAMRAHVRGWGASVFVASPIEAHVQALARAIGGRPVPGEVFAFPSVAGSDDFSRAART